MSAGSYIKEVLKQLNYYPTWMPGKNVALGEVGILKKGEFVSVTTLEELGIPYQVFTDTTKNDFKIGGSLAKETNLGFDITAPIASKMLMDAGLKLSFGIKKEKELVFLTKGIVVHQIKNTVGIGSEIEKLYQADVWEREWKVITEVVETDATSILYTKTDNAEILIQPSVTLGKANIEILDTDLQWKIISSSGMDIEIISQEKFIPLFMARKIERVKGEIPKRLFRARNELKGKESLKLAKINFADFDVE